MRIPVRDDIGKWSLFSREREVLEMRVDNRSDFLEVIGNERMMVSIHDTYFDDSRADLD